MTVTAPDTRLRVKSAPLVSSTQALVQLQVQPHIPGSPPQRTIVHEPGGKTPAQRLTPVSQATLIALLRSGTLQRSNRRTRRPAASRTWPR
jgi:hypothetical protein